MSRRRQTEPVRHLSVKKKPKQVPAVDPRFDGQHRPIDRPVRTSRSIPVIDLLSNGPPVPNLINLPDRVTPAGIPPRERSGYATRPKSSNRENFPREPPKHATCPGNPSREPPSICRPSS